MSQTKIGSLLETITARIVLFLAALTTQILVFPLYGISVPFSQNISMTLIFTFVGLVFGYLVRRGFEKLHRLGYFVNR